MKLKGYMKENHIAVSELSRLTGISYMTLNDLYKEKTMLSRTSAAHLYKIAKALGVSMEDLLIDYLIEEQAGFGIPAALMDLIKEINAYRDEDPYGFRIEALDNLENFSKDYCLEGAITWDQRDKLLSMVIDGDLV